MLLTDEERFELFKANETENRLTLIQQVEAAILAKLASAELPEPSIFQYDAMLASPIKAYTADQLRQAYAQGAAAQLSAGSVAVTTCDCYPDHGGTIYAEAVLPQGTPLYTRRQAND